MRPFLKTGVAVAICVAMGATQSVAAGDGSAPGMEFKIPGIWTDPDGCQHWVMDDGWEGFMTPNVTPDGKPVCGQKQTCAIVSSDLLFDTNEYVVSDRAKKALLEFFRNAQAKAFRIEGHTDNRASDAYNIELSLKRARAVSAVAMAAGHKVTQIAGYGERAPKQSNGTAAGMAANRRVEIECVY